MKCPDCGLLPLSILVDGGTGLVARFCCHCRHRVPISVPDDEALEVLCEATERLLSDRDQVEPQSTLPLGAERDVDRRARIFHGANPRFYAAVCEEARAILGEDLGIEPFHRTTIARVFERIRDRVDITVPTNNSFRAWYARRVIRLEPDLAPHFATRKRKPA